MPRYFNTTGPRRSRPNRGLCSSTRWTCSRAWPWSAFCGSCAAALPAAGSVASRSPWHWSACASRACAAGRGRIDLGIEFNGGRHIVEIKLVHPADGRDITIEDGLRQIDRYADRIAPDTIHLVIFDRRSEARAKPWDARLARQHATTPAGRAAAVIWC